MKITPQDIINQEFKIKFKGYDKDEVRHFLMEIAESLEKVNLEKEETRKEIEKLENRISQSKNREEILRDTLISAQKFSHEIKSNAEKEANLIIREAEIKGDEIINNSLVRQKELREEIKNLQLKRREIENEIIIMLDSLKELIESFRREDNDFDKVEFISK